MFQQKSLPGTDPSVPHLPVTNAAELAELQKQIDDVISEKNALIAHSQFIQDRQNESDWTEYFRRCNGYYPNTWDRNRRKDFIAQNEDNILKSRQLIAVLKKVRNDEVITIEEHKIILTHPIFKNNPAIINYPKVNVQQPIIDAIAKEQEYVAVQSRGLKNAEDRLQYYIIYTGGGAISGFKLDLVGNATPESMESDIKYHQDRIAHSRKLIDALTKVLANKEISAEEHNAIMERADLKDNSLIISYPHVQTGEETQAPSPAT